MKEVDHCFDRETRMREARAGTDSIEIVEVPLGIIQAPDVKCVFLKRNIRSPSSNARFPQVLLIDHFFPACVSISLTPKVSPEREIEEVGETE